MLRAPPEAAGPPKAYKHGGRAWLNDEILNFLIYEVLVIFINCPILLGFLRGLRKFLALWFSKLYSMAAFSVSDAMDHSLFSI